MSHRGESENEGRTGEDLQRSSSGDDLNELLGDDGLSGTVEGEGQLVNHLSWRATEKPVRVTCYTLCWRRETWVHDSNRILTRCGCYNLYATRSIWQKMSNNLNKRLKRWAQTFTDFSFSNLRFSCFSPIHTFVNSAYLDFGAQSVCFYVFHNFLTTILFFI